jgi:hypothetical protein
MGIFITLAEPSKPMLTEAVKEGFYETPWGKYPCIQIRTVAELLRRQAAAHPARRPIRF